MMDLVSFLIGFFSGILILAVAFAAFLWKKLKPLFAMSDGMWAMDDLLENVSEEEEEE